MLSERLCFREILEAITNTTPIVTPNMLIFVLKILGYVFGIASAIQVVLIAK